MIFCFSSRYGLIKALKILLVFSTLIHRKHWTLSNGPPANQIHRFQLVGVLRKTRMMLFFLISYHFADSSFFPNSHHITISGGIFSSGTVTSNPVVVHDPVVREQSVCPFLFLLAEIYVLNNCSSDVAQNSPNNIYPMRRFIFLSGSQSTFRKL